MHTALRTGTFVAAAVVVAACASKSNSTSTGPGGPSGTAANIVKVSGDSQSDQYDVAIPEPLVVKVTDASGATVTDASVAWAIQLAGVSQTLAVSTTNASGDAQISPVLGGMPGVFSVTAGIDNHSVTFTGNSNVGLASGLRNLAGALFASCGLTAQGSAYCWGSGAEGGLGNGATGPVTGPVPVSGGYTFAALNGSAELMCGLTGAGALYCWGQAIYPQMGNGASGSTGTFATPTAAGNGMTFSLIAAGDNQSCGISAGVTYCWGFGAQGALGTGDTVTRDVPTAVHMPSGVSFTSLASGWGFSCGLTAAGAAYCWGANGGGQLGIGSSSPSSSNVPIAVAGGHTFTSLSAGSQGMCGLTTGGTVYCWGQDINGNGTSGVEYAPTAIQQSGLTFTELAVDGVHACALTAAGAAYCWGDNSSGALGSGSFTTTGATPVAVTGGHTYSTIFAMGISTCGYTTAQVMYCWGANQARELGLPATADTMYAVPQPVPGLGSP